MYFKYSQVFNKQINCGQRDCSPPIFDSQLKTVRDSEWNHGFKRCAISRPTKWVYGLICSDELYGSYGQFYKISTKKKKKKKKKKKGGGKVYSRSVRDFQCLCSFKLTSGIVIKVFPFSKGKTFMYFVWLLLCRPDYYREATYCYSSVSLLLFFLFLFLSFFCPPYIWEVTEDDVMNLWIMLDECLEICMHNLNFSE